MPAANILIAPSGGDATTYNAAAYALLTAGNKNGTPNTVRWQSGYRYAPEANGKIWGKSSGAGQTCNLPVEHYIVGGDSVLIDGRVYYAPGSLDESNCAGADYANGYWKVKLATAAAGFPTSPVVEFYTAASAGALASSFVLGTKWQEATALVNVDATGSTKAGMRAGKGIWFAAGQSTATAAYIYIYTGTSALRPDVYYGGFAVTFYCGSSQNPTIASPRYSPFIFGRESDITFNPSGSIIRPGFTLVGFPLGLFGSPTAANTVASRPITDVLYQDVAAHSAKECIYLGSDQSGTVLDNWRFEGSGDLGSYFRNNANPDYYPGNAGASDSSEIISIERRVRNFEFYKGTAHVGVCHGVINQANAGTTVAEEWSSAEFSRLTAIAYPDSGYTRGVTMNGCENSVLSFCSFTNFTTNSQLAGKNTLAYGNSWVGSYPCIDGDYSYTNNGTALVLFDADSETVPSTMSIRFYGNTLDRRGDSARGVDWNVSLLNVSGGASVSIPAFALDLQGNVLLQDPGKAIWKSRIYGGGTIDRNQTYAGNYDNYNKAASAGPMRLTSASQAEGTELSIAGFFTGPSAVLTNNVTDTSGRIQQRGDLPAIPAKQVALAPPGAGL